MASASALSALAACTSRPAQVCGLGCAGDAALLSHRLGAPLRSERIFHQVEPFPGPEEMAAWAARRVPVSSFKTLDASGAPIPFASVAAGAADLQLDTLSRSLNDGLRGDMVLIYFHEPEAEAGAARTDFAAAFRQVRSRVDQALTTAARERIRWAMCLTHSYYTDGSADLFYPGDDAVDLLAVDGYNWCPGSGHGGGPIAFRDLFTGALAFSRRHAKPWMITEVGTWNDPAPGRSKAEWIAAAVPAVKEWSSLEAVLWFEYNTGFRCDWTIGEDADALAAFKRLGEGLCRDGEHGSA